MNICKIEKIAPNLCLLSGTLTFATASQTWENYQHIFEHLTGEPIQFNLKEIVQCDSAGAALLIAFLKHAQQNNKKIIFTELPEQLRAILQVSGLKNLIL